MKFAFLSVTYAGQFYKGPALSLVEQIRKARALGFDGVSIETKRPVASPLDLTRQDRQAIKAAAAAEGVELCAIESMSNFASPLMEERENNLAMMRLVIDLASDLEVRTVKVFAAWPGVVNDEDETAFYAPYEKGNYYRSLYPADLRRWRRAVSGLRESADYAQDRGVTLALQNHAPVTNSPADMLRMIREVDSPHVKACLDAPLAARQGVTSMQDAARDVAGLQVLSHFGGEYQHGADGSILGLVRNPDETLTPENYYLDFALGMQEIGYEGYIGYELCHPIPPVDGEPVGLDFADLNAKLAAEYMRGVLAEAARTPAVARAV